MTESCGTPILSIVIPCYNEAACLPELHRRVSTAAQSVAGSSHEIVLVNDGSSDPTWEIMAQLGAEDDNVVAINLSRNHGHQLALTAGLDLCRGHYILIIDADLQDPPELLPDMFAMLHADKADVIYGVRDRREGETAFKRASSHLFYRLLSRLTDTNIPVDTGDFRLMTRRALDTFLAMPEQARFIRGMVSWVGFRQFPIMYQRESRLAGTTKYSIRKMVRLALDALTGFSTAPLKIASQAGLLLAAASIIIVLYSLVSWFTGKAVAGWTSLMLVIVSLGAIQMFVLGVIGEYLGRLYHQSKNRPLYIVQDVIGRKTAPARLGINAAAPDASLTRRDVPISGISLAPQDQCEKVQ